MIEFEKSIGFNTSSNDVISVGELLIDMMATDYGDELNEGKFKRYFGGAPANIAMNVTMLGGKSLIAASVGKDSFGSYLIHCLKEAGLDTTTIEQVDNSTSMVVLAKSQSTPLPIFYRSADFHLQYNDKLQSVVELSKIIHFSCWPISRQPARETIEKIIEDAKHEGKLICFDPNYHPQIWDGDDGVAYIKSLLGSVDIVKPSEVDAERLFGPDIPERQIKKFLECGVSFVIMTLGKDGALVSNGLETRRYNSLATEIVDTTGAGDAFWSGFYCSILNGQTVDEALLSGFAVSAYKLKHVGAVVQLPNLEKIRTMYGL